MEHLIELSRNERIEMAKQAAILVRRERDAADAEMDATESIE